MLSNRSTLSVKSADDLQPGDILFSTKDSVDSLTRNAEHVMMILGKDAANVAHAIFDVSLQVENESDEYRIQNQRVAKTSLPEGKYSVLRLKDRALALAASDILNRWTAYLIPYDEVRATKANRQENTVMMSVYTGGDADKIASLEKVREQFRWDGLFRAIKFAARSNTTPIIPVGLFDERIDNLAIQQPEYTHGMFCSQLIVTAIQVAALLRGVEGRPLVRAIVGDTVRNVSNKHIDLQQLDELFDQLPSEYQDVKTAFLTQADVSDKSTQHHTPSLAAWNFEVAHPLEINYETLFVGLDVSAKDIMPDTLLYAMASDKNGFWEYCELFDYKREKLLAAEKDEYRSVRKQHFEHAIHNRNIEAEWLSRLPSSPAAAQPHYQTERTFLPPELGYRSGVGDIMLRELALGQYYSDIFETDLSRSPGALVFNLRNFTQKDADALGTLLKNSFQMKKNIVINLFDYDLSAMVAFTQLLSTAAVTFKDFRIQIADNQQSVLEMKDNKVVAIDFSGQHINRELLTAILKLIDQKADAAFLLSFNRSTLSDELGRYLLSELSKCDKLCLKLNLGSTCLSDEALPELKQYVENKSSKVKPYPEIIIDHCALSEIAKISLIEFNSKLSLIMRIDVCGIEENKSKHPFWQAVTSWIPSSLFGVRLNNDDAKSKSNQASSKAHKPQQP